MRELKFRIWSKEQKTYKYGHPYNKVGWFYINELGNLFSDYGNIVCPEYKQDEFVVEQYTGLKDKNGKEIYEGDIATIQSKPYIPDEYIIDAKPIIFMNGLFSIKKSEFVHIPIYLFFNAENITHDIEVIGNIHENKELL